MDKKNIKLTVDENEKLLTIEANKETYFSTNKLSNLIKSKDNIPIESDKKLYENLSDNNKFHHIERSYGMIKRSFSIPDDGELENIKAIYSNGVLIISIPKKLNAKSFQNEKLEHIKEIAIE